MKTWAAFKQAIEEEFGYAPGELERLAKDRNWDGGRESLTAYFHDRLGLLHRQDLLQVGGLDGVEDLQVKGSKPLLSRTKATTRQH